MITPVYFAGDVGRGEDEEPRVHRHLVGQGHFLAVAQRPSRSGKGRRFLGLREEAQVVGHNAHLAHARPDGIGIAGETGERREFVPQPSAVVEFW